MAMAFCERRLKGNRLCDKEVCHRNFEQSGREYEVYSDFCDRHTCHAYNPFNGKFCKSSVGNKATYCPRHMTCNVPGCGVHPDFPSHRNDKGIAPVVRPHPDHKFYCEFHKNQIVQATGVPVATQIRPATHMPYVRQPTFPPSTAQPPPAPEPPVEELPIPCDAPDCPNFAEDGSDYCSRHFDFIRCEANGCSAESQTGPDADQQLCIPHTCQLPGCQAFKRLDCQACRIHVCGVKDCPRLQYKGKYCRHHVCTVNKCERLLESVGGLCLTHKCKIKNCNQLATVVGGYCRDPGHGCSEDGCAQQSVTAKLGGDIPDLCGDHYRRAQDLDRARVEANGKKQGVAEGDARMAAATKKFEEKLAEQTRVTQQAVDAAEAARAAFFNGGARTSGGASNGDSGVHLSETPSPGPRDRRSREYRYYHGSNASFPRSDDSGPRATTYVHSSTRGRQHRRNGSQYVHPSNEPRYATPPTPSEPMFRQHGSNGHSPPSPRYWDPRGPQMRPQDNYADQPFFDYESGEHGWAPQDEIPSAQSHHGMPHSHQYRTGPYPNVPPQVWPSHEPRYNNGRFR